MEEKNGTFNLAAHKIMSYLSHTHKKWLMATPSTKYVKTIYLTLKTNRLHDFLHLRQQMRGIMRYFLNKSLFPIMQEGMERFVAIIREYNFVHFAPDHNANESNKDIQRGVQLQLKQLKFSLSLPP